MLGKVADGVLYNSEEHEEVKIFLSQTMSIGQR